MKTTLDLPAGLVQQIKLRAVRQRRKLKDAIADLLRKGLAADSTARESGSSPLTKDKSGLPLLVCRRAAPPGEELTPQLVADILLQQDVAWHDETR